MIAVGQIRAGTAPVAEENDTSLRKRRRQIDERACISSAQNDAERQEGREPTKAAPGQEGRAGLHGLAWRSSSGVPGHPGPRYRPRPEVSMMLSTWPGRSMVTGPVAAVSTSRASLYRAGSLPPMPAHLPRSGCSPAMSVAFASSNAMGTQKLAAPHPPGVL